MSVTGNRGGGNIPPFVVMWLRWQSPLQLFFVCGQPVAIHFINFWFLLSMTCQHYTLEYHYTLFCQNSIFKSFIQLFIMFISCYILVVNVLLFVASGYISRSISAQTSTVQNSRRRTGIKWSRNSYSYTYCLTISNSRPVRNCSNWILTRWEMDFCIKLCTP